MRCNAGPMRGVVGGHKWHGVAGKNNARSSMAVLVTAIFLVVALHRHLTSPTARDEDECELLPPNSRVAVIVHGQSRTLDRTHCSVTEHLIDPILKERHRLHVFMYGEEDVDSWQYRAYARKLSERGIAHTLVTEGRHAADPTCVKVLDDKYEKRIRHLMEPGVSYAAELLAQHYITETANNARKRMEMTEGKPFDAVILARPDVTYTAPLPPLCKMRHDEVHLPPWQSYRGVNDRFLMARSGPALDHFMELFGGLCDRGFAAELPRRSWWWLSGKGLSSERIYALWMKKGGFNVKTNRLRKFVFYRLRRRQSLAESPDGDFGQHKGARPWNDKHNPSSVSWMDVVDSLERCPKLQPLPP